MQRRRTRIYGPYHDEQRALWRVVTVEENGQRASRGFESEAAAHDHIAALEEELSLEGPITVEKALDAYELFLRKKGNKAVTVATTMWRLRSLMKGARGRLLAVDAPACYEAFAAAPKKNGAPIAVDTHRNTLAQARTFGKWAVKVGHLRSNPWSRVEPEGARRRGKPQLRVDEARKFTVKALELADTGDDAGVAALCCLLLGLRASEVVERVGRDVDDNGSVLRIEKAKTESGIRRVAIPELLRPYLAERARGDAPLFRARSRYWLRDQVRALCKLAGVPIVGPHGLRGTHATLAIEAGASSALVAATMGHASVTTTLAHYAKAEAVEGAATSRAMRVIAGGRR